MTAEFITLHNAPLRKSPRKSRNARRRQRKLPEVAITSLVAAYKHGDPINDIAETTVLSYIESRGLEPRTGKVDRRLNEAIALYQSGGSLAKVGRHLRVDPETVRQAFRRNGVPIRPRNGWAP
jgi:hypothetical protein